MKSVKLLIIACLLIGFSGCVVAFRNANEENLGDIYPGMSKTEVTEAVGQPLDVRTQLIRGKQYEIWIYPIERFFARQYNPLGYLYYEIVFSGNKVKEWHRTKLFSQPQYELEHIETPEQAKTFEVLQRK